MYRLGAMEDHPRNQPECEAQRTSEQACGDASAQFRYQGASAARNVATAR